MSTEIQNPTLTPVKPDLGIKDWFALRNATGIGAVDKNEPRKSLISRLAAIPALGTLVLGACGGATEPPPTSTTVIEPTATLPQPTTTTTKAPTITTSTTVPETPTTTLDPKEDITKASGDIYDGDKSLDKLGFVRIIDDPSNPEYDYIMLVKPVSLNTVTIENFQGEPKDVIVLTVSLSRREDGSPYIRKYMVSIPNENIGGYARKNYTRNFNAVTDDAPLSFKDEELTALLNQIIEEKREVGIALPYEFTNLSGLNNCFTEGCNYAREMIERFDYNTNTYNDLINQSAEGVVQSTHENEPEMGAITEIYLFPPLGGW